MNYCSHRLVLTILLPLVIPVLASAQMVPIIITDERRSEFVENLDLLLHYDDDRFNGETIPVPDPYRFERTIPVARQTQTEGVVPMMAILERVGGRIASSVTGFQDFGGRSFLATRDFGLIRNGQTLTLRVPDMPGEEVRVQIDRINRDNFTIIHQNEELEVPLGSDPEGIRRTNR